MSLDRVGYGLLKQLEIEEQRSRVIRGRIVEARRLVHNNTRYRHLIDVQRHVELLAVKVAELSKSEKHMSNVCKTKLKTVQALVTGVVTEFQKDMDVASNGLHPPCIGVDIVATFPIPNTTGPILISPKSCKPPERELFTPNISTKRQSKNLKDVSPVLQLTLADSLLGVDSLATAEGVNHSHKRQWRLAYHTEPPLKDPIRRSKLDMVKNVIKANQLLSPTLTSSRRVKSAANLHAFSDLSPKSTVNLNKSQSSRKFVISDLNSDIVSCEHSSNEVEYFQHTRNVSDQSLLDDSNSSPCPQIMVSNPVSILKNVPSLSPTASKELLKASPAVSSRLQVKLSPSASSANFSGSSSDLLNFVRTPTKIDPEVQSPVAVKSLKKSHSDQLLVPTKSLKVSISSPDLKVKQVNFGLLNHVVPDFSPLFVVVIHNFSYNLHSSNYTHVEFRSGSNQISVLRDQSVLHPGDIVLTSPEMMKQLQIWTATAEDTGILLATIDLVALYHSKVGCETYLPITSSEGFAVSKGDGDLFYISVDAYGPPCYTATLSLSSLKSERPACFIVVPHDLLSSSTVVSSCLNEAHVVSWTSLEPITEVEILHCIADLDCLECNLNYGSLDLLRAYYDRNPVSLPFSHETVEELILSKFKLPLRWSSQASLEGNFSLPISKNLHYFLTLDVPEVIDFTSDNLVSFKINPLPQDLLHHFSTRKYVEAYPLSVSSRVVKSPSNTRRVSEISNDEHTNAPETPKHTRNVSSTSLLDYKSSDSTTAVAEHLFHYLLLKKYDKVDDLFSLGLCDVDKRDSFGNEDTGIRFSFLLLYVALMVSCMMGNKKLAKVCLRRGANINAINRQGQTALHYCYANGYDELGAYLISKGANVSLKNVFGLDCYSGLLPDAPVSFCESHNINPEVLKRQEHNLSPDETEIAAMFKKSSAPVKSSNDVNVSRKLSNKKRISNIPVSDSLVPSPPASPRRLDMPRKFTPAHSILFAQMFRSPAAFLSSLATTISALYNVPMIGLYAVSHSAPITPWAAALPVPTTSHVHFDYLLSSVLHVFLVQDKMSVLIKDVMKDSELRPFENDENLQLNCSNLLRGTTLATKVLSSVVLTYGRSFLKGCLSSALSKLRKKFLSYKVSRESFFTEIDPFIESEPLRRQKATSNLQEFILDIVLNVTNIESSPVTAPLSLTAVALFDSTSFLQDRYKYLTLASLFFVRFICPTLTALSVAGSMQRLWVNEDNQMEPVPGELAKLFIRSSSILQRVSTLTLFNTGNSEDETYLAVNFNPWLSSNILPKIQLFYDHVSKYKSLERTENSRELEESMISTCMENVLAFTGTADKAYE